MQPKDLIKDKLSIVDVISSYIPVIESGKNYKAKCPFHNEKTPSFFISADRNTYYCFGCGEKGDIFSFVEKFEGTDFLGALKLLAARAGVPLTYDRNDKTRDDKDRWLEIMEEATVFFESNFAHNLEARTYMLSRGLNDASMSEFRVGFAQDGWRSLSDYLTKKGYSKQDLETVGLIKIKEGSSLRDESFYDRFRSRIMFPISDSSGRVIAFSGRIFGKSDKEEAKYLNSPDTPLFNKSNVLFGIDKAKSAIRTRGYSIIVEGQMDLVMSHQAGFSNTVAVSGTALTDDVVDKDSQMNKVNNLGLIRRLSENIIFAYDGDDAGVRAASRSAVIALSLDMQVKIAVLPQGQDPADIIATNQDMWKDIIKNSTNIVTFHIDRICKNNPDLRSRGKKIREVVFPFLSVLKSAIERSAYINEIHSKTGIPQSAIVEDFASYEKSRPAVGVEVKPKTVDTISKQLSRGDFLEKRFFSIVFWQVPGGEYEAEIDSMCEILKTTIGNDAYERMMLTHEPFREGLSFEAQMWYSNGTGTLLKDMEEIALNLEEEILNSEKLSLQPLETSEKLARFNEIVMRIEQIKHKRFL